MTLNHTQLRDQCARPESETSFHATSGPLQAKKTHRRAPESLSESTADGDLPKNTPADRPEIKNHQLCEKCGLALAFLVEISQLYHAPWIDAIRQTALGGLVLGFGFLWTDLVCYSVGVMIGVMAERAIVGRMRVSNEP